MADQRVPAELCEDWTTAMSQLEPFGRVMREALENARVDPEHGEAVWVEADYCTPPLAMGRRKWLTSTSRTSHRYENVNEATGWVRMDSLPGLWTQLLGTV